MIKYILLLFIILALIAYYFIIDQDLPVVTLYPDSKQAKIKPEIQDRGGVVIPHADNRIYETLTPNSVVKKSKKSKSVNLKHEQPLALKNSSVDSILDSILSENINQEAKEEKVNKDELNVIYIEDSQKLFPTSITPSINYYQIQLACVKNEETALGIWNQLKQKFPKILQNANMDLKKVQKAENKFYFLLLAGPYHSLNSAHNICRKLIARGQHCIINP